jgi:hypothetical protein
MSPVLRSRHRKHQAANASLELLAEAEKAATTTLVAQAAPSIFSAGGRALTANRRMGGSQPASVDMHHETVAANMGTRQFFMQLTQDITQLILSQAILPHLQQR